MTRQLTDHNRYLAAMKKLHGTNRHTCRHPECQTLVLGDYCLEHLERAIAKEWEEIETADNPRQTGE
jgi:hypothetical protein